MFKRQVCVCVCFSPAGELMLLGIAAKHFLEVSFCLRFKKIIFVLT